MFDVCATYRATSGRQQDDEWQKRPVEGYRPGGPDKGATKHD